MKVFECRWYEISGVVGVVVFVVIESVVVLVIVMVMGIGY